MINEITYLNRDNIIALSLSVDGTDIAHNALTRCQVKVGTTMLDSEVSPLLFDFTNTDKLILNLGASGLPVGDYTAVLYVFDANNARGIRWGDFLLTVST